LGRWEKEGNGGGRKVSLHIVRREVVGCEKSGRAGKKECGVEQQNWRRKNLTNVEVKTSPNREARPQGQGFQRKRNRTKSSAGGKGFV